LSVIYIYIYSTSSIVLVPIIWFYVRFVLVLISFSVIVSCIFSSLLLVTVVILYSRAGSCFNVAISILFDGESISFDASLAVSINNTNIPSIMIMNRVYENQNLQYIFPLIRHTTIFCISSISPMATGCFICVNINLVIVFIDIRNIKVNSKIPD